MDNRLCHIEKISLFISYFDYKNYTKYHQKVADYYGENVGIFSVYI